MRSMASAIHSTPAMPSASSGLRAASIAMIRSSAEMAVHPLLEPADLAGELLLVEEHGRVGQVHHELGRVLELDEEFLDVLRLVIHGR